MTIKELKKGIKDLLKVYKRGSQNQDVVIGVPHKSPKGEECIKCGHDTKVIIAPHKVQKMQECMKRDKASPFDKLIIKAP